MLTGKLKHFAICVSALAAPCAPAQAAATITVAVTPIAANAISDLVPDFQSAFPTAGYSVSVVVMSDDDAKADIVASGGRGLFDLFLSKSPLAPTDLKEKNPGLVVGDPFPFAKDTLVLYSNTTNISGGLPSAPKAFSLPDPATLDSYGVAAVQALRWQYLYALNYGLLIKAPDAGSSYAAVEYLGATYGFTGKSQICTAAAGVEEFLPGTFHHEYRQGVDYSNDIVLTGVKLTRTRTADENAELNDFVRFLTGAGRTSLKQHCFKSPA